MWAIMLFYIVLLIHEISVNHALVMLTEPPLIRNELKHNYNMSCENMWRSDPSTRWKIRSKKYIVLVTGRKFINELKNNLSTQ